MKRQLFLLLAASCMMNAAQAAQGQPQGWPQNEQVSYSGKPTLQSLYESANSKGPQVQIGDLQSMIDAINQIEEGIDPDLADGIVALCDKVIQAQGGTQLGSIAQELRGLLATPISPSQKNTVQSTPPQQDILAQMQAQMLAQMQAMQAMQAQMLALQEKNVGLQKALHAAAQDSVLTETEVPSQARLTTESEQPRSIEPNDAEKALAATIFFEMDETRKERKKNPGKPIPLSDNGFAAIEELFDITKSMPDKKTGVNTSRRAVFLQLYHKNSNTIMHEAVLGFPGVLLEIARNAPYLFPKLLDTKNNAGQTPQEYLAAEQPNNIIMPQKIREATAEAERVAKNVTTRKAAQKTAAKQ